MSETIKFSFIMPTYNDEKYIETAIKSVIEQTYNNWELIIMNDGSTDNTLNILRQIAKNNSRIKVFSQPNSGSGCAARNACLQYVTGDYIQMLDADDYISCDMLDKYSKILKQNNNYDIIIPNLVNISDQKEIISSINPPENNYDLTIDGTKAFYLSLSWKIHGCGCVKTSIYKSVNYCTSNLINEDEFASRKILYNAKIIGFANTTYYYRYNLNSTTKRVNIIAKYQYLETEYKIYKYSLSNKMPDYIINTTHKKYYDRFLSNSYFFIDDLESLKNNIDKYNYIKTIMEECFRQNLLKDLTILYKDSFFKKIFIIYLYIFSKKDLYNFSLLYKQIQKILKKHKQ